MLRSAERIAVAIRNPGGDIAVATWPIRGVGGRLAVLERLGLRSMVVVPQSLAAGVRAMLWSTGEVEPGPTQVGTTLAVLGGTALFGLVVVPHALVGLLGLVLGLPPHWGLTALLAESVVRIAGVVGYLFAVTRLPDNRRLLAYHGAEHKVVNALEQHGRVDLDLVRGATRFHRRCGTSFIALLTLASSLFLPLVLAWLPLPGSPLLAHASAASAELVVMAPSGVLSYELMRWLTPRDGAVARLLTWPGLALQRWTAQPPDDEQLEVAIAALVAVNAL